MMQMRRVMPYVAGALVCLAVVGIVRTPNKVSAAVRAALVEVVIPSRPYADIMTATNGATAVGPGTGTLGVTNLTLTNFDTSEQQVFVFNPVLNGSGCSSPVIGGGTPEMTVYVQPHQTLVIPYPTPLVFSPLDGNTCVAAEVTTLLHGGSVQVDVTGFVN